LIRAGKEKAPQGENSGERKPFSHGEIEKNRVVYNDYMFSSELHHKSGS